MNTILQHSQLILLVILVAGSAGGLIWRRWSLRRFTQGKGATASESQDDSEIIAFYSAGHSLARASRGDLNGMTYATYITTPGDTSAEFVNDLAVINVLDLPFNTSTYLIGLSKQHKIDRMKFDNFVTANGMEKVVLEGDFRDYFDVYAAKDQQIEAREVLNPKSMAFAVDFCKSHFWEINHSELYFAASSSDKGGDNAFQEAIDFVGQIKPALRPGDPGAPVVHHEVPYGEYDGPPLNCPICNKPMTTNSLWHTCPDGHGILISGRELDALHEHVINIPSDPAKSRKHGQLTCPNSHDPMEQVDYEGTGINIISCPNCPYRWLDANEISALSSKRVIAQTG